MPHSMKSLLSPREFEVAGLVRDGYANRDIATLTGLSEDTVKHHIYSIFDKVGCYNRTQLAVKFEREYPFVESSQSVRA